MRTTPATRAFADEEVPDRILYSILDAARFAPSGGNRQAWHVILLKDRAVRQRIRDLYVLGWREYMAHVLAGQVAFAPGSDGRYTGPAIDLEAARATPAPMEFADRLDRVPVLMVIVVDLPSLAVMDNGLGRQSLVGGASVYPLVQNILLAARDAGLGGVMTTVLCRQEPAVRELLGLESRHAVASLVALGRPAKPVTKLTRRAVDSFTTIDRLDGPAFSV